MQSRQPQRQQLLFISPVLLLIVMFFAAGISWAETLGLPLKFLLHYCVLLLVGLLAIIHGYKLQFQTASYALLGVLFFFLGLLQHASIHAPPPADSRHIYNLISEKQAVSIDAILLKYPSVINADTDPETRILAYARKLHQFIGPNHIEPKSTTTTGRVLLTLKGALPADLLPGDRFFVKAEVNRISTYSTPGSFNYKKYLADQAIFISGWVQSPHNIIKLHAEEVSLPAAGLKALRYFPERVRHHIAMFIDSTLKQPARGLYKAILIGDRNDVPAGVLNNFTGAGCIHILAISGMHMGLLALVTIAFLSWLLKRSIWLLLHTPVRKVAVTIALLPLLLYALIAGFNIPVLRALLMTIVFVLAILFDRPGNLINHILLAAFLILLWKPGAIFSASFQLSFGAVFAIALIYPLLHRFLLQDTQTASSSGVNSDQIQRPLPVRVIYGIPRILRKWSLAGAALTTAAMLGTFPLLLFHFNRFSLVAPLTNLLVEPLVCFWSLIIGLVACLCIPILPALAKTLFIAGSYGLIISEKICAFFTSMPYSSFWFPSPSPMEIILFYLFLISSIIALHSAGRRQRYCLVIALLLFSTLLASPVVTTLAKQPSGSATITFLDVGHGCSILLELPENKNILIDGGGSESERFDIGERVIGPFLWNRKLSSLDAVVVTHPHADHYNGLPFILTRFHPKEIWINGFAGPDKGYTELLDLANQLGIAVRIAKADDILYQYGTSRLLCIRSGMNQAFQHDGLKQAPGINPNDLSIMLRLDTNNKSFLFPADISADMADMLVKEGENIRADILMAPHHGGATSFSRNFIKTVAPEYIAISAGRNNRFNYPAGSFHDLQKKGMKVFATNRDGTITFHVEQGKLEVSRFQVN